MTNTNFMVREQSGVNQITLLPMNKTQDSQFRLVDGALVIGFLGAFVALVFLLAK
jgi:hypothetical protein